MSVGNKIRALLQLKGKGPMDLAAVFDISPQAMRNKLSRNSFSAEDLIKIADYLECDLNFDAGAGTKISLDIDDVRK